ncbi:YbaN family protein [Halalkalibacterium ligniniphilum]|uniref:YbaN family protein n=1 Tax=Halalkalibacterium ligniniphilum TaxID=1134413 RepID=UPI00034C1A46|nr:YbaN family protein [Halalkalibacterium ligniniphilum]
MIKNIKKFIYLCLGFFFIGLGIIGIILPLVPTTPFLLLASACFVRGSERFDRWFKGTTLYKKHLEGFLKERALTLQQKITINAFADCMIAIPFILSESLIVKTILVIIVGYKYYYFIYKIKTIRGTVQ